MSTVRALDGLRYGFKLLGLALVVLVVGGVLVAGGGALAASGLDPANPARSQLPRTVGGGVVALVGVLWLAGGWLGILYKLIADGVGAGLAGTGPATAGDATAATTEEAAPESASEVSDGAAGATGAEEPMDVGGADDAVAGGEPAVGADEPIAGSEADEGGPADGPSGEELDRVVSQATEPSDDEPYGGPADGGAASGTAGEPEPVEETGAAGEEEFEASFEDVEDTTDEAGDWEPLDEDDL